MRVMREMMMMVINNNNNNNNIRTLRNWNVGVWPEFIWSRIGSSDRLL
jgi:hypothetical protein